MLGRFWNFLIPSFLVLQNGGDRTYFAGVLWEFRETISVEGLKIIIIITVLILIEHFKYITRGHRDLTTKWMEMKAFPNPAWPHPDSFCDFHSLPRPDTSPRLQPHQSPWPSFQPVHACDHAPLSLGSASITLVYRTPTHLSRCSSNVTCSLKPPLPPPGSQLHAPPRSHTLPPHPLNDHNKHEDQALGGSTLFELIQRM